MNRFILKSLKSSIFSSIGLIILGILLFFQSEVTIISISYVIGGILIAIGTIALINYAKNVNKDIKNELDIVYGIGMVILGIVVIANPKTVASIFPCILGVIVTLNSSIKLEYSFQLRKQKNILWKSTMILSLVTLLCGILLIFNPFKGAEFFVKAVGVLLFIYGITDFISTLRLRKTIKNIQNLLEGNDVKEADVIEDKTKK